MRALLLNPKFPYSYWTFDETIELLDRKSFMAPLGLVTVAAILPQEWEFRLVDCHNGPVTDADWAWADMVMISGLIAQRPHMMTLIGEAKRRGKPVAVGGPYVTSVPDDALEAGADFLVLDEGEITIPMFVEALARGETSGCFRAGSEKPDVTTTPIPRYDLLKLDDYAIMPVQFSRGCPFMCEFCDIITLYGRRPRAKRPMQVIAELQTLYDLGWRGSVFMVDDNLIGNMPAVKPMLKEVAAWQKERSYPFAIATEASINLADHPELMTAMRLAHINVVFIGIETPDEDSLRSINKLQNVRKPLVESIKTIASYGLRINAGFIVGFDDEKPGADQRIIDLIEETAIPQAVISMLYALPQTQLTDRLRAEGRLLEDTKEKGWADDCLINFLPTRPAQDIAQEHINANLKLYEPASFIRRVHRLCLTPTTPPPGKGKVKRAIKRAELKGLAVILWRNGVLRPSRGLFWSCLFDIYRKNRKALFTYFLYFFNYEHLYHMRDINRDTIQRQLEAMTEDERTRFYQSPTESGASIEAAQ